MADVRLVDLALIKRYSLAVRTEWAPADEVLAVLDETRVALLAAMGSPGPTPPAAGPEPGGQPPRRRRRTASRMQSGEPPG